MENKSNVTELVFILDKSGSMAGYEGDTVGGFNSMIERQRALDGKVYVSTVLFNNHLTVLHDRVDIGEISPMSVEDFRVGGGTALIDAIGSAIHHIGTVHKYARPEDVPEHTMFIITTDGMENASHVYSSSEVKDKIERQSKRYGWEFVFMAANIDAVETAKNMGISHSRAMNFEQSSEGIGGVYRCVSNAVYAMRTDPEGFRGTDIKKMKEEEKNG